jgi:hypothetical protein
MDKLFLVSADHAHADYRFVSHVVRARQSTDGTWFATASGLGCSKDYATAEEAVKALFEAQACFNIRW